MALVSIVVPVYYNASSLTRLAERLDRISKKMKRHRFEFIYVDDGSGDDSLRVLKELQQQDDRITIVKLTRNFGSNTAILAGLTHAKGDCAGFVAADLQDPPEVLERMIELWEKKSKVVFAVRKSRRGDPLWTRMFANLFNTLFKKFVFQKFYDQGIGFFLIDRRVVDVLIQCNEKNVHLIGLIFWSGFDYQCVDYDRVGRESGKSRWTFNKKIKYFIDAFTSFSYLPLRSCLVMGLGLAGFSVLYALLIVILRLSGKFNVPGWSALMVAVLFLSGMQLIMLGTIGEYLWRNFDATRQRPPFVIEKIIQSGNKSKKNPARGRRNKG
jgi:dolichol-phosphate mannosyltransferase